MRKLKLQMQISIDGYVAGPNGEMDWMEWNWDDEIKNYVKGITEPVDCILLGRKLADGFIPTWESRLADPTTADDFAKKMVNTPKIVFSKKLKTVVWDNTELVAGDHVKYINQLKNKPGRDIIVYGGSNFVASLIKDAMIDDYHLFINPTAIGTGMSIFNSLKQNYSLKLMEAKRFSCGIALLHYSADHKSERVT